DLELAYAGGNHRGRRGAHLATIDAGRLDQHPESRRLAAEPAGIDRGDAFIRSYPDPTVRRLREHRKLRHANRARETVEPVEPPVPERVAAVRHRAIELAGLEPEEPGPGREPPGADVVLPHPEDG